MTAGTSSFVSNLVVNVFIAIAVLIIFAQVRTKYPWCFESRRVLNVRKRGINPPPLPNNAFGWMLTMYRMDDQTILHVAGLDSLMLIKFYRLCVQLFGVCTIFGIAILLPVNFTASEDSNLDAFNSMAMGNIPDQSHRFWAHLIIAYFFAFVFYHLSWKTWKEYIALRAQYMKHWALNGGGLSVLVHNIPNAQRTDKDLLEYFKRLYPNKVRSAYLAKDLGKELPEHLEERAKIVKQLEHTIAAWNEANKKYDEKVQAGDEKAKKPERPKMGTKMMCLNKKDALDHLTIELCKLNGKIASDLTLIKGREPPYLLSGFVTFNDAFTQSCAYKLEANAEPYEFSALPAPEWSDIFWPSLNMDKNQRAVRHVVVGVALFWLIVFWMIPITFAQSIANLKSLQEQLTFLRPVNDLPGPILGFIEGFLPALVLIIFFILLPIILLALSKAQGIEANSWLQRSVMTKFFLFVVFNYFLGTIISGSIFQEISGIINSPTSIPSILGRTIPTAATSFVNYVALAGLSGFPIQLLQIGRLVVGNIKKKYLCKTPREVMETETPPETNYGAIYPRELFIFILGITYGPLASIILPFATIYYGLGLIVQAYNVVYVNVTSYESGGLFWPVVFDRMVTCQVIGQLVFVGVLGLKQVPAPAILVLPLPFLTILFKRMIHQAFDGKTLSLPVEHAVEMDQLRQQKKKEQENSAEVGATAEEQQGLLASNDKTHEKQQASQDSLMHDVTSDTHAGHTIKFHISDDDDDEKSINKQGQKSSVVIEVKEASTLTRATSTPTSPTNHAGPLTSAATDNHLKSIPSTEWGFNSSTDESYTEGDVELYKQPELDEYGFVEVVDAEQYLTEEGKEELQKEKAENEKRIQEAIKKATEPPSEKKGLLASIPFLGSKKEKKEDKKNEKK